ncbi:MAG: DUF4829 domain-containing protein [Sporolactobacillus sp.]
MKKYKKISQTNSTKTVSKESNVNGSNKKQDNVVIKPNKDAKETILKFYQSLEKKDYKSATALLGPQIKFEGKPKMIKYLKNIQKATFHKLIDISNENVPDLYQYKKYYAVKVYYGEVDFKVKDPNLVPALTTTRYRNIYVIKEKKNDPWKIDMDSETPQR